MGRLADAALVDDLPLFTPPRATGGYPEGVPPDVCDLFEQLAMDVKRKGFDQYSARAILHQIRWHHQVERGDREFKCNDHWTPALARWVAARHPEMAKFFELRSSPHKEPER